MNHEYLPTTGEYDILAIAAEFLPRLHFKARPIGCFDLVVWFPCSFTVNNPVHSIDKFSNIMRGGIMPFQISVYAVFIFPSESVDVGPYDRLYFLYILLTDIHFLLGRRNWFTPILYRNRESVCGFES